MPWLLSSAAAAVACAALPAVIAWGDSATPIPVREGGYRPLSRQRRELRFPEGATFSMALCLSWAVVPSVSIWTETIAVELDYDLQKGNDTEDSMDDMKDDKDDDKKEDKDEKDEKTAAASRWRSRRDVFQDIEDAIHLTGHDGRACVHRAICEAAEMRRGWLTEGSSGSSEDTYRPGIVMHILDLIFRIPELSSTADDPSARSYWSASRHALTNTSDCGVAFAGCPFSLLDIAISGRYQQDFWA
ncbi:uncharacterized protein LOC126278503 [Schistocerca gregaria]|uniref:uncharacterized protein LOC126278503 n=1 Tax=Schistocerca gregaria TaxID=7010 RepID=UPI00211DC04F|nr:uncharacterized protein LOC126278503 [Schistocerca gregaria]